MTQVLTVAAFVLAIYFPVAFYIRSDWNANAPGKATMVFSTITAIVLGLAMLRSFGVVLPDWFRALCFLAIVVGLAVQDITLTKVQNRRRTRLARERVADMEAQR